MSASPSAIGPDARVFEAPYGYFLEVTTMWPEIAKALNDWIASIRRVAKCVVYDNDTDEEISEFVRDVLECR